MSSQRQISLQFGFSQDYRRQDQLPSPDEFPIYSETATISKINIQDSRLVRISKPSFQIYGFRSKLALSNPVSIAIIASNEDLEDLFKDPFVKLFDDKNGIYDTAIAPNSNLPQLLTEEIQKDDPYRIAYSQIEEFSDYPTNLIENYKLASFRKIVLDTYINKEVLQIYSVQSDSYQSQDELLFKNSNNYSFIYLIPYVLRIQKTQVAVSGRLSFMLEDIQEELR